MVAGMKLTLILAGSSLALACTPAIAQQEPAFELDEITVTAQKRDQSLQDVPISITAFGEAEIEQFRIDSFTDYAQRSPNVGFINTGSRFRNTIAIRGVTNLGSDANSFGIYIDEFNIAPTNASRTYDPELQDIERIEVLRGPQGTLFGRNTIGGAISIVTKKPSAEFEGEVVGEYARFDDWLLRGTVNGALTDNLFARAVVYRSEDGGFLRNAIDGGAVDDARSTGGRLAVRALPSENVTLDLAVAYTDSREGSPSTVPGGILSASAEESYAPINFGIPGLGLPPGSFFGLPEIPIDEVGFYPDNRRNISFDGPYRADNETMIVTNRLEVDADFATITLVGGYIDNDFVETGDGDLTSLPVYLFDRDQSLESFSQELRLTSNDAASPLRWTAGFIYSRETQVTTLQLDNLETNPYAFYFGLLGLQPGLLVDEFERSRTNSYAAFGEASLRASDWFEITGGARVTYDRISERTLNGGQLSAGVDTDVRDSFTDVSPRLTLTFYPSDEVTIYTTASRGYKAGGFTANDDFPSFEEEKAWNFEAGLKADLLDRRLRINAAAFYIDWTDIQVSALNPQTLTNIVQNAASASSKGFELELTARPVLGLTLAGGLGYVDAAFDEFEGAFDSFSGDLVDASGNRLPRAPEWTLNASAQYDVTLTEALEGFVRAEYARVGSQFGEATNNALFRVESYELVNVRLGVDSGAFSIIGFVENILGEDYYTGVSFQDFYLTGSQVAIGRPRTYGARVSVRF